MAAMAGGEGAAVHHGEIGDIEIRHARQPGPVRQVLQIVDETRVAIIAQPFAADHLIARSFQRQGHGIFQAAGRVAADGFGIEGAGGEQQGGGEHGTPGDDARCGLRQPQAYQECPPAVIRAACRLQPAVRLAHNARQCGDGRTVCNHMRRSGDESQ